MAGSLRRATCAAKPIPPRASPPRCTAPTSPPPSCSALTAPPGILNVSDLLLDRHDLLARVQALTGCPHPLPPRAEGPPPGVMDTARLRALGWRPPGLAGLDRFLAETFPA